MEQNQPDAPVPSKKESGSKIRRRQSKREMQERLASGDGTGSGGSSSNHPSGVKRTDSTKRLSGTGKLFEAMLAVTDADGKTSSKVGESETGSTSTSKSKKASASARRKSLTSPIEASSIANAGEKPKSPRNKSPRNKSPRKSPRKKKKKKEAIVVEDIEEPSAALPSIPVDAVSDESENDVDLLPVIPTTCVCPLCRQSINESLTQDAVLDGFTCPLSIRVVSVCSSCREGIAAVRSVGNCEGCSKDRMLIRNMCSACWSVCLFPKKKAAAPESRRRDGRDQRRFSGNQSGDTRRLSSTRDRMITDKTSDRDEGGVESGSVGSAIGRRSSITSGSKRRSRNGSRSSMQMPDFSLDETADNVSVISDDMNTLTLRECAWVGAKGGRFFSRLSIPLWVDNTANKQENSTLSPHGYIYTEFAGSGTVHIRSLLGAGFDRFLKCDSKILSLLAVHPWITTYHDNDEIRLFNVNALLSETPTSKIFTEGSLLTLDVSEAFANEKGARSRAMFGDDRVLCVASRGRVCVWSWLAVFNGLVRPSLSLPLSGLSIHARSDYCDIKDQFILIGSNTSFALIDLSKRQCLAAFATSRQTPGDTMVTSFVAIRFSGKCVVTHESQGLRVWRLESFMDPSSSGGTAGSGLAAAGNRSSISLSPPPGGKQPTADPVWLDLPPLIDCEPGSTFTALHADNTFVIAGDSLGRIRVRHTLSQAKATAPGQGGAQDAANERRRNKLASLLGESKRDADGEAVEYLNGTTSLGGTGDGSDSDPSLSGSGKMDFSPSRSMLKGDGGGGGTLQKSASSSRLALKRFLVQPQTGKSEKIAKLIRTDDAVYSFHEKGIASVWDLRTRDAETPLARFNVGAGDIWSADIVAGSVAVLTAGETKKKRFSSDHGPGALSLGSESGSGTLGSNSLAGDAGSVSAATAGIRCGGSAPLTAIVRSSVGLGGVGGDISSTTQSLLLPSTISPRDTRRRSGSLSGRHMLALSNKLSEAHLSTPSNLSLPTSSLSNGPTSPKGSGSSSMGGGGGTSSSSLDFAVQQQKESADRAVHQAGTQVDLRSAKRPLTVLVLLDWDDPSMMAASGDGGHPWNSQLAMQWSDVVSDARASRAEIVGVTSVAGSLIAAESEKWAFSVAAMTSLPAEVQFCLRELARTRKAVAQDDQVTTLPLLAAFYDTASDSVTASMVLSTDAGPFPVISAKQVWRTLEKMYLNRPKPADSSGGKSEGGGMGGTLRRMLNKRG